LVQQNSSNFGQGADLAFNNVQSFIPPKPHPNALALQNYTMSVGLPNASGAAANDGNLNPISSISAVGGSLSNLTIKQQRA